MFKVIQRHMAKERAASLREPRTGSNPAPKVAAEKELSFKESIGRDVTPLPNNIFTRPNGLLRSKPADHRPQVVRAPKHQKPVVDKGPAFTMDNFYEYMEDFGPAETPDPAKPLYCGDFYIQDQIDLHGLARDEAKAVFDNFLQVSIKADNRLLLVVHGQGLSSPGEPVLKYLVGSWLTRGPWKKWILAFSSARAVDGGTGATYILLRREPIAKSPRQGKSKGRHR
jgi:DNA-nicking Smr family endonuclease